MILPSFYFINAISDNMLHDIIFMIYPCDIPLIFFNYNFTSFDNPFYYYYSFYC